MLLKDINRYLNFEGKKPGPREMFYLIFTQGVWATVVYRFGSWNRRHKIPVLSMFLGLVYFFLNKSVEISAGISISCNARIGGGLYIGHFGQIIVHPDVIMGENCNIGQGITIGTAGVGKTGAPVIGNNVYIGTGAKVLGRITIGNNVRIGANAVVIKDIPDNATAVGVPAKVVKTRG
ncbi:serine O-acetyltransferase [Elusimicrobiota bacterium]